MKKYAEIASFYFLKEQVEFKPARVAIIRYLEIFKS